MLIWDEVLGNPCKINTFLGFLEDAFPEIYFKYTDKHLKL